MLWNTLPDIIKSAKNDAVFKYISIGNRKSSWPVLFLTTPFVFNFK